MVTTLEKLQVVAALVAVALFLWAAAVIAGWSHYGNDGVLLAIGLAFMVFALMDWPRIVRR